MRTTTATVTVPVSGRTRRHLLATLDHPGLRGALNQARPIPRQRGRYTLVLTADQAHALHATIAGQLRDNTTGDLVLRDTGVGRPELLMTGLRLGNTLGLAPLD